MNDATIFALGIGTACIGSIVAMAHLHRPLRAILTDLCGTTDRAAFWCAFSNITLFLLPLIFMLDYQPDANGGAWLWVLAAVLKRGLVGLVISVVTLGIVIASFIRRGDVRALSPQRQNS
jgi:predicted permease